MAGQALVHLDLDLSDGQGALRLGVAPRRPFPSPGVVILVDGVDLHAAESTSRDVASEQCLQQPHKQARHYDG